MQNPFLVQLAQLNINIRPAKSESYLGSAQAAPLEFGPAVVVDVELELAILQVLQVLMQLASERR